MSSNVVKSVFIALSLDDQEVLICYKSSNWRYTRLLKEWKKQLVKSAIKNEIHAGWNIIVY